jgi:hypothetical protein
MDPLSSDDWESLAEDVAREGTERRAKGVVLPAILPTAMGLAVELRRSLADNLRARGLTVIVVGEEPGGKTPPDRTG